MAVKIDFAGSQIDGTRDYQEDAFEVFDHIPLESGATCTLLVLCDGMGGHKGGRVASNLAMKAFHETFVSSSSQVRDRLDAALKAANAAIAAHVVVNPELDGMGTTLVGGLIIDNLFHWISVGDSPMWLVRDGALKRLNADHSMAPVLDRMVEIGELSAEDAGKDAKRNQLRSALTGGALELIDLPENSIVLKPGDQVLLASDGLETLSPDRIAGVLQESKSASVSKSIDTLLQAVTDARKQHQDNTTIILCRIKTSVTPTVMMGRRSNSGEHGTAAGKSRGLKWMVSTILAMAAAFVLFLAFMGDEKKPQPPAIGAKTEEMPASETGTPEAEQSELEGPLPDVDSSAGEPEVQHEEEPSGASDLEGPEGGR